MIKHNINFNGYDLQNDEHVYYEALNNLAKYNFVGIRRKDPSDKIDFAGKIYAFEHYYNEGKDLYLHCNNVRMHKSFQQNLFYQMDLFF